MAEVERPNMAAITITALATSDIRPHGDPVYGWHLSSGFRWALHWHGGGTGEIPLPLVPSVEDL